MSCGNNCGMSCGNNCGTSCGRSFFGIDQQTLILILVFWFFFCTGGNLCGNNNCGNACNNNCNPCSRCDDCCC